MRHFNSPDELTPQEARDAWYPYLGVDEIDLYEILFSDMSDDYSCVHRVILWLPKNKLIRDDILKDEFPEPDFRVVEISRYEDILPWITS